MHELAIAAEMVEMVKPKLAGKKLVAISIEVGAFSGVVKESLEFCTTTLFEEAFGEPIKILIHLRPGRMVCACGTEYESSDALKGCPSCHEFTRRVETGREVFIQSIEVAVEGEDDDPKN